MSDMFCYFARIILWSQSLLLGIHIFYHLLLSSAYKNIIKFSCMCVCVLHMSGFLCTCVSMSNSRGGGEVKVKRIYSKSL